MYWIIILRKRDLRIVIIYTYRYYLHVPLLVYWQQKAWLRIIPCNQITLYPITVEK